MQEKEVIYLLSLLPYFNEEPSLNPSWNDGDNVEPALHLAKDQINAHPHILQDYRMEFILGKSGCQQIQKTIVSFVEEAYYHKSRRKIAGIIGPACSASSIGLAPLTNRSAISLVMMHGSGSPTLADRKKYLYHLGTLGDTENFVIAIQYLLKKWQRVAILYDDSRIFYTDTKNMLIEKVENMTILEYIAPVSVHFLPLDDIIRQLLRVVVVMCNPQLSRYLICLSLRKNMTYDSYQWVYMAHTEDVLVNRVEFRYDNETITCTEEEMADALNNQILLLYSLETSTSSSRYQDYLTQYKRYREQYNARGEVIGKNSTYSEWAGYFYDSVWAWALVLDNLTKMEPEMFGINGSQLYGNLLHANLIMEQFYNTRFEGITGPISYNRSTGFTPRTVKIIQISSEGEVKNRGKLVARIQSNDNREIIFQPIQIPDSFSKVYVRENKHIARLIIFVVIAQFLMTLCLHVVTSMNVKHPTIKATTPKLLYLSYIGVYIMLLGVFIHTIYPAVPLALELKGVFCQIFWSATFSIGFTLSLGPVAMRTWRLYRIFVHYRNPGPFITNPVLIGAVLVMVMVDILIAVIWATLDRFQTKILEEYSYHQGFKIVRVWAICTSPLIELWIVLMVINKLFLLIFVTTLAFLTKNIRNLSFTTNSLRVLVYMITIITVLGFSLSLSLSFDLVNPNYSFITLAITMISLITVFMLWVFLPPLLPTLKNYFKLKYTHHFFQ